MSAGGADLTSPSRLGIPNERRAILEARMQGFDVTRTVGQLEEGGGGAIADATMLDDGSRESSIPFPPPRPSAVAAAAPPSSEAGKKRPRKRQATVSDDSGERSAGGAEGGAGSGGAGGAGGAAARAPPRKRARKGTQQAGDGVATVASPGASAAHASSGGAGVGIAESFGLRATPPRDGAAAAAATAAAAAAAGNGTPTASRGGAAAAFRATPPPGAGVTTVGFGPDARVIAPAAAAAATAIAAAAVAEGPGDGGGAGAGAGGAAAAAAAAAAADAGAMAAAASAATGGSAGKPAKSSGQPTLARFFATKEGSKIPTTAPATSTPPRGALTSTSTAAAAAAANPPGSGTPKERGASNSAAPAPAAMQRTSAAAAAAVAAAAVPSSFAGGLTAAFAASMAATTTTSSSSASSSSAAASSSGGSGGSAGEPTAPGNSNLGFSQQLQLQPPSVSALATENQKLKSQLIEASRAVQTLREQLKEQAAAAAAAAQIAAAAKDEASRAVSALESEKAALSRVESKEEERKRSAAGNLARILREVAVKEAAAARQEMAAKVARIGRQYAVRNGANVYEAWEDGEDYLQLAAQEAALEAKKKMLEKLKKEIGKRNKKLRDSLASVTGSGGSTGGGGAGAAAAASAAATPKPKPSAASAGGGGGGGDDSGDDSDDDGAGELSGMPGMPGGAGTGGFALPPAPTIGWSAATAASLGATLSTAAAAAPANRVVMLAELELTESEESVKLALAACKRDLDALLERRRALDREKSLLFVEMKRQRQERESRFRDYPTLDNGRVLLLQLLGKGGFSEVWRAMDLYEAREVAVKVHQLSEHWPEEKKQNYVKHALREYHIQQTLQHPHLVRLYSVIEIDSNSFATVLEYCRGTDLDKLLKDTGALPEREARAILIQMLSALRYMNGYTSPWEVEAGAAAAAASSSAASSGGGGGGGGAGAGAGAMDPPAAKRKIIHYDLKPANILFDEFRNVKIADFGLSKIVGDELGDASSLELTSQGAGTYWYLPPECFEDGPTRISNKVDVWSVGVIFYQTLFGRRPFGEGHTQEQYLQRGVLRDLATGKVEVAFPAVGVDGKKISPEAKAFIKRCLTPSQEARPDVFTLCEDPYLYMKQRA